MPAPPPQSLPCSPRSCPRSNSSLAFVPSSQVSLHIYIYIYIYTYTYLHTWYIVTLVLLKHVQGDIVWTSQADVWWCGGWHHWTLSRADPAQRHLKRPGAGHGLPGLRVSAEVCGSPKERAGEDQNNQWWLKSTMVHPPRTMAIHTWNKAESVGVDDVDGLIRGFSQSLERGPFVPCPRWIFFSAPLPICAF